MIWLKPEGSLAKIPGRTGILGYWPLDRDLAVWIKLLRRSNLERRRWIGRPGTNHARGGDGARRSRAPAAEHCRRWPISVLPGLIRAGERLGRLRTARVTHLCQARGAGTLWAAGAVRRRPYGRGSPACGVLATRGCRCLRDLAKRKRGVERVLTVYGIGQRYRAAAPVSRSCGVGRWRSRRGRRGAAPGVRTPGFDSWMHEDTPTVALVGWKAVERWVSAGAEAQRGGARRSGVGRR